MSLQLPLFFSGMYMGEVVRQVLVELMAEGLIFR
jgi:hexokinase